MTIHHGIGPGIRGGWKRRIYRSDGTVEDIEAQAKESKAAGFQEFISYQPTKADAEALRLKRAGAGGKGTVFETRRDLENYLARQRDLGRETGWRDW